MLAHAAVGGLEPQERKAPLRPRRRHDRRATSREHQLSSGGVFSVYRFFKICKPLLPRLCIDANMYCPRLLIYIQSQAMHRKSD